MNIILYNMFTPEGANLYGTEAWYFYLLNLLLNFNIVFSLAMAVLIFAPLALAGLIASPMRWVDLSKENCWIPVLGTIYAPFLWLWIFTSMSHKEERFLVPIYPMLCFLAALSLDLIQVNRKEFSCFRFRNGIRRFSRFLPSRFSTAFRRANASRPHHDISKIHYPKCAASLAHVHMSFDVALVCHTQELSRAD